MPRKICIFLSIKFCCSLKKKNHFESSFIKKRRIRTPYLKKVIMTMIFTKKKILFIKSRQNHYAKLLSSKDVNNPCFQNQVFAVGYWVGRSVGSRFPPYTTLPCKICNFAKKVTSFPEIFIFFGFYRWQLKRLFLGHSGNARWNVCGTKDKKSNRPYIARPLHHIK